MVTSNYTCLLITPLFGVEPERFQEQGKLVSTVFPTLGEPQYDKDGELKKIDFNDVHKALGIDAVKEQTKEPEKVEVAKQTAESVTEGNQKNVIKNVLNINEKNPATSINSSKIRGDILVPDERYNLGAIEIPESRAASNLDKDAKSLDDILQLIHQKNNINTELELS